MSAHLTRPSGVSVSAVPLFEVRMMRHGAADTEVEVWQLPSPASPQVQAPLRLAGLRGRNFDLGEDDALRLGLLFRTLAPMQNRSRVRAVAEGVEAMEREEAGYWLGMAMHRRNPRRILTALRFLLTDPHRTR